MWGNSPRGPPQMGSFGSVNQNMSMRQAMLNEAKHMGPIGTGSASVSNNVSCWCCVRGSFGKYSLAKFK